jgi:hypothetical protein
MTNRNNEVVAITSKGASFGKAWYKFQLTDTQGSIPPDQSNTLDEQETNDNIDSSYSE